MGQGVPKRLERVLPPIAGELVMERSSNHGHGRSSQSAGIWAVDHSNAGAPG